MKNIFTLIVFFSSIVQSFATHFMGSDLSYKYVGPYKYKVTVKFYRDCTGIPLNNPDFYLICPNGSIKIPVTFTRVSIKDISNVCSKDSSPCSPTNTPSNFGVEEHIYESTIDFSLSAYSQFKNTGCCEVKIAASQCCRNGAITTISPGNFYTEAMLNVCKSEDYKNNSPEFLSKPIQYLCCNNPLSYANSMVEIDGEDSISFELVAPLNENNSNESYTGIFTPTSPMTVKTGTNPPGFLFNKSSGSFIITPIKCDEVGIIVTLVTEWRKDKNGVMQKVGTVRREMQMLVKNCGNGNNSPNFSGTNIFSVCETNKLCFDVVTKDDTASGQSTPDSTYLTLKSNNSKATFTIKDSSAREKVGQVCWQTKLGDAKKTPYVLTFKVEDDHCGDPRFAYKECFITVKKMPVTKLKTRFLGKGKFEFESIPSDSLFSDYTYKYEVLDINGNTDGFDLTRRIDTFSFTDSGRFMVVHTISSKQNCVRIYQDTIEVKGKDLVSINDIQLKSLNVSPNPGQGKFNIISEVNYSGETLKVYNVEGKLVKSVVLKTNQFDITDLSEGVYVIEVKHFNSIFRTQIMLMH